MYIYTLSRTGLPTSPVNLTLVLLVDSGKLNPGSGNCFAETGGLFRLMEVSTSWFVCPLVASPTRLLGWDILNSLVPTRAVQIHTMALGAHINAHQTNMQPFS